MEVHAVYQDSNAHCCIRVDITTRHTFFVENTGSEYAVTKMRTEDFNHRFVVMENYDVKRAARKYLSNSFTPHSPAALAQLHKILKENTMSEAKTFRAPAPSAVGAKTLPNKVEPAKTAAKEKASDPKKAMGALKDAAKTAKVAKKEAPKAEPKKAPVKSAKPAPKAPAKKAAAKPAAKGKAPAKKASSAAGDDRSIKSTGQANECREGSFCHAQVKALQSSKTVSEAQAKLDKSGNNPGERRIEVAWAAKMGYIKVIG